MQVVSKLRKMCFLFFFREEDQLWGGPHHPHRRSERGGVPQAGLRRHHRVLPHQNHQQVPSLAQTGGHSQNHVTGTRHRRFSLSVHVFNPLLSNKKGFIFKFSMEALFLLPLISRLFLHPLEATYYWQYWFFLERFFVSDLFMFPLLCRDLKIRDFN